MADKQIVHEARPAKKTAEDLRRDQKRHSLEMSRRRITRELGSTKSDIRRASLEAALKHLDSELSKL